MNRENKVLRLCRALSGLRQDEFEQVTGIPNIPAYETGVYTPTAKQLARCASATGRSLATIDWLMRCFERPEVEAAGEGLRVTVPYDPFPSSGSGRVRTEVLEFLSWAGKAEYLAREERIRQRAAERRVAEELRINLEGLTPKEQRALVRCDSGYRSWALACSSAEHSERLASKDVMKAMQWAELGCYVADRVEGPLRLRAQGFCRGYLANSFRVCGSLTTSDKEFGFATQLWEAGEDPEEVFDPGRLLELEASLRSNQGRPEEALRLLLQAEPIGRRPAQLKLKKAGFLAELGHYTEAVDTLLELDELIEMQGEPRLRNVQKFSLCSALCHLGRYREAAELLPEIRRSASELGDELDLYRIQWIDGRIARGLGERERALVALEAAAGAFAGREMLYDMALARFEVATLHLEMGRHEKSAAIACELVEIFRNNGDHQEARKAIELFHEALAARRATIELAVAILEFLFLAQYRRELVFAGPG